MRKGGNFLRSGGASNTKATREALHRALKKEQKRQLDGYELLKLSGLELPEELIRAVVRPRGCVYESIVEEDMSEFSSLTNLDLSGNRMDLSGLCCFPALRELNLSCNQLDYVGLPQGPGPHFETLTALNLSFNKIEPESLAVLGWLPQLQFLDISENKLRNFPEVKKGAFPCLKKLVLRRNRLGKRRKEGFREFTSYHDPESSFYKPHYTFLHTLSKLPALRELDLSSNNIQVLPAFPTKAFSTLQFLNLAQNYLAFEEHLLSMLDRPLLKWVDIRENAFECVDEPSSSKCRSKVLSRYDFPKTCAQLLRSRRGNIIIAGDDGVRTQSETTLVVISAASLCALAENLGYSDEINDLQDNFDFTEKPPEVEDPTEKLERELEDFEVVQQDNTFLTTGFPSLAGKLSAMTEMDRTEEEDWYQAKNLPSMDLLYEKSTTSNIRALELAIKRISSPPPDILGSRQKHHMHTTIIQRLRQKPLIKKKKRHERKHKALQILETRQMGAQTQSALEKVQEQAEMSSRRKSGRQTGRTSSSRSARDVQEVAEAARKMLII
ncbi:hypothetical protein AAMO2058_001291800 [Amorphochlora amoebiformis]